MKIRCAATGVEMETTANADGSLKLPKGWKRFAGESLSPAGMGLRYCPRSLTVPIHSVVVEGSPWADEARKEGWRLFRTALCDAWRECARLGNYVTGRLMASESAPEPALNKKGKETVKLGALSLSETAMYNEARTHFPRLMAGTVSAVVRRAVSKYKRERWSIRVECSRSAPSWRAPAPLPIRKQEYEKGLRLDEEGFVSFAVNVGGTRFLCRLKSNRDFERQLGPLRRAAAGELPFGEMSLRDNDGQVLCGIAVSMPRGAQKSLREESLNICTDANAFLVAECGRVFVLNEDAIRQLCILRERHLKHAADVRRTMQDLKAERRFDRKSRRNRLRWLEAASEKHDRRVSDLCHKVARMVAEYARRRKCGMVIYDDRDRSYIPGGKFPWARLRTLIGQKLDEYGIGFIAPTEGGEPTETGSLESGTHVSGEDVAKDRKFHEDGAPGDPGRGPSKTRRVASRGIGSAEDCFLLAEAVIQDVLDGPLDNKPANTVLRGIGTLGMVSRNGEAITDMAERSRAREKEAELGEEAGNEARKAVRRRELLAIQAELQAELESLEEAPPPRKG